MGMSNWILDNEDKFWDKVYDKITESEHISEAMSFAVELGKYAVFGISESIAKYLLTYAVP